VNSIIIICNPFQQIKMNRREILKQTSLVVGGALSLGTISAVMGGCKAESIDLGWVPKILSTDQAQLVSEIAERIIPKTDTPGAKDAGVASFIDNALDLNILGEKRSALITGLTQFSKMSKDKFSRSFIDISDEDKDAVIKAVAADGAEGDSVNPVFKQLRELVVAGFFSSEVGAKGTLAYDPIPGEYKGCINFKDVGKAYAL